MSPYSITCTPHTAASHLVSLTGFDTVQAYEVDQCLVPDRPNYTPDVMLQRMMAEQTQQGNGASQASQRNSGSSSQASQRNAGSSSRAARE